MGTIDSYTWSARIAPVFLVCLPFGIAAAPWFPDGSLLERIGTVLLAPGAFAALAAQLGRDRGKNAEQSLWSSWGGRPTTTLLRHGGPHLSEPLRAHYHSRIRKLAPHISLPSPEEQAADAARADMAYEEAATFLRAKTRDQARFPVLFKENKNYGFRRNLWGMRADGIAVSLVGVGLCLVRLCLYPGSVSALEWWIAISANSVLAGVWVSLVSPAWVKVPAVAYAERLLEALDQIE